MASPKTCQVLMRGPDGVAHEIEVSASSVYEATARAIRAFKDQDWSMEAAYWTGCLEVIAKQPEVKHKVLLKDFEQWLTRHGGSPREISQRQFLQKILDGRDAPIFSREP